MSDIKDDIQDIGDKKITVAKETIGPTTISATAKGAEGGKEEVKHDDINVSLEGQAEQDGKREGKIL